MDRDETHTAEPDPKSTRILERFPLIAFFEYGHLPGRLQVVSLPFAQLAWEVAQRAPDGNDLAARRVGAETTVAIRKLLEAKDAAVRAALS